MTRVSYVNGAYVPHHQAFVHIEDRGYQFSDGVYEYIAFYNKTLVDGDLHFQRLERSLDELELAHPMSRRSMAIVVRELIERNGRDDGGLYIQITRGVAKRDHAFPKNTAPALVMTLCRAKLPKDSEVRNGVAVITRPDIRWGRRDIKSISLLPNILAKQKAAEVSAREAWLVDGDIISEGSASNSYIISKSGELITHPANECILGGITRDVVLKLARKSGIKVSERVFTLSEIKQVAEAFLTSTSANVLPVVKVDNHVIGDGKVGKITKQLNDLYTAHIFNQTGKQL
jgi:D-alanine transaminase